MRIIHRPNKQYYFDYIQYKNICKKKDKIYFHYLAAISYGFKLDLIIYNVPGNINGKMPLKVYRDQILEPVIKPWLLKSQDFILIEDCNSKNRKVYNRNII